MERNFHTCTITGLKGGWIELFAWAPPCPKFVSDCSRRPDVQNMPRPFMFQTIKEDRPMNKISTVYLERFNFSPLPYFFFPTYTSRLLSPPTPLPTSAFYFSEIGGIWIHPALPASYPLRSTPTALLRSRSGSFWYIFFWNFWLLFVAHLRAGAV